MKTFAALAACGAALSACAPTQMQPLTAADTAIPFAAHGGIRDWYSNNEQSIFLRDRTGRWYLATFNGLCPNLPSAQTIRFETDASGSFDRFSSIGTEYGRCQVGSVVLSQAPAAKGGGLARP